MRRSIVLRRREPSGVRSSNNQICAQRILLPQRCRATCRLRADRAHTEPYFYMQYMQRPATHGSRRGLLLYSNRFSLGGVWIPKMSVGGSVYFRVAQIII